MKKLTIALLAMCALLVGCSDDDESETSPATYDIIGLWKEYAYLSSGGYYVDISNTGYADYYQFDEDGTYNDWSEYDSGSKYDGTSGTWEYSVVKDVVLVTEPRGWNLNITLKWSSPDSVQLNIVKRGGTSSSVKCKRVR